MLVITSHPRMKIYLALLVAALCIVGGSRSDAQTLNWGDEIGSDVVDSKGQALPENAFVIQLGSFANGFTPDETNVASWISNWRIFDQSGYNSAAGFFSSTVFIQDGVTSSNPTASTISFAGLDAYIWIRNSDVADVGTEWLLTRADSWKFAATGGGCCNTSTVEWSVTDLTNSDTPLWGKQGDISGLGAATDFGSHTLQTHSFVPEPSAFFLSALTGVGMLLRRRREPGSTMFFGLRRLLFLVVWFAGTNVYGQTINWFSDPQQTNRTSSGSLMDGGFQFELGVFTGSFVPTVANKAEWSSNWVAAARTSYFAATKRFDHQFTLADNNSPFTAGKAAYVWGFSGDSTNGEWILFRAASWTWPAYTSGNMDPFGQSWSVASATAVLGAIDPDGSPFLMQSVAVGNAAPPATTWEQWQAENLSGEPLDGPDQDPDRDGISNLMEFVFGTAPKSPGAGTTTPISLVDVSGQLYLQITVPRRIDHSASLAVQVSADLIEWNSGASYTVVVEDSAAALIVRDLIPFNPANPKRFMRLKASLP